MRQTRRWRWSATLAGSAALLLVITGCGGSDSQSPADGPVELAGVSLQLMGWSSSAAEDDALTGLIEAFNAETGAAASFNPVPEYDTTLQAALAGGSPPDVFYVDSNRLPDLADAGILQPVPDGAISDPDDIYPSLRESFTYEGTWYCPPKDFSTLALVYDVDAFEAADLAPPTTWAELRAAAEALTTDDQAGLVMGVEYARWAVFMFQAGSALTNPDVSELTIDTPAAREALTYLAELHQAGLAVSPSSVGAGWAGEAFGQGKAAMTIEGNWIVAAMGQDFPDRNYAVAELPVGPAGPGTFAFTVCYGVAVNAANPAASWALVEHLTSAAGALAWTSDFPVMPARESVRDDWLAQRPELAAFLAGADYAHKWQFRPGFSDVLGVFDDQAQAIVAGNGSVDELVARTSSAGQSVLG